MAVQTNIDMWAGDTRSLEFTVKDEAGTVVDITTYDVFWVLKPNQHSATATITKDLLGGGITLTDPTEGQFMVEIGPEDTQGLAGAYYFEADIVDNEANNVTVAYGFLSIRSSEESPAYCTLEEAMSLMAELDISERTRPNLATAQIIVETISGEIDGILLGRGYGLPITDAAARKYLKSINQYGSCAAIIRSRKMNDKGASGDAGSAQHYETKYREGLANISNTEYNLLSSDENVDTQFAWGGEGLEYGGVPDAPFFTRGMLY